MSTHCSQAGLAVAGALLTLVLAATACQSTRGDPAGGPGFFVSSSGVGSSGGGTGGSDSGGGAGGEPSPPASFLPLADTSDCPELTSGTRSFTFDTAKSRNVELRISDAAETQDGPIYFLWHGSPGTPFDALDLLGNAAIVQILAAGGVVVAPYADPAAGLPLWFYTEGGYGQDDDLLVMDQVLACVIDTVGIDLRRIHTLGFGEGARQATQVAVRRSGYIASVAVHSAGFAGAPMEQDPSNAYAVMIAHGGPGDLGAYSYEQDSLAYFDDLISPSPTPFAAVHFAFICNHQSGHVLDQNAVLASLSFLTDHPYGTVPSPYAAALPAGFPAYCELP